MLLVLALTGTHTAGSTVPRPAKSTSTSILHTPTASKVTTTAIKRTNTCPTSTSPADLMWPSKKKPKTDKPANNPPPKGKPDATTLVAVPQLHLQELEYQIILAFVKTLLVYLILLQQQPGSTIPQATNVTSSCSSAVSYTTHVDSVRLSILLY